MWQIKSIKHQTRILLISLTLGLTLVFSSVAVITAFVVEDKLLFNLLEEQANYIEQHYARNGELPSVPFDFIQVFTGIDALPEWARERVARNKLSGEIFTADKSHYHYRKLAIGHSGSGYLLAEVSSLLVVTNQPGIFSLFLLVFISVIILVVLLAARFSQRIVAPVLALIDAVIANEKSDAKAPLPKLQFELGYLSASLQTSFDRLHQLLEREKAFATNVSHELRTPLTVLKNSGVLIAHRGFKADDLLGIQASCEQMEHTIDILLALARAESLALQPCNLTSALERAILKCQAPLFECLDVRINLARDWSVIANPRLLELLLINLLRNVSEHASEPVVTVTDKEGKLVFENRTELNSDSNITRAGIKGSSSSGVGQGLYLVARIAEHFNWQLAVESSAQRFRVIINPQ